MSARVVATFGTKAEADLAAARLAFEGIAASTVTDSLGGFEPQLDMIRGVRLIVADYDLLEAALVLGVDVPDPIPDLTDTQERLVSALQWMAFLVAGFGLFSVVWRALTG